MKLFKKAKKGFTLVELVVVIAVIAILAAVSVGAYFGVTDSANKSRLEQEAKHAYDSIQLVSLVDANDGFDLDSNGLHIESLSDFERELDSNGIDYHLRTDSNSISTEQPTIVLNTQAVHAQNTMVTYKQFNFFLPEISGMHANCNFVDGGKITIIKAESPEPEEHEHTFVEGICTGCGEADPDYVAPNVVTGVTITNKPQTSLVFNTTNKNTHQLNAEAVLQDSSRETTESNVVIEWEDDNSGFASVDESGLVTAHSEGATEVTAIIKVDGVEKGRDTASISVTKPAITVNITTEKQQYYIGEDSEATFTATVSSEDTLSDYGVNWSTNNQDVSISDEGKIIFGTTTFSNVEVTATSKIDANATDTITISLDKKMNNITISNNNVELTIGEPIDLKELIAFDGETIGTDLTFTCSNDALTIDGSNVTATKYVEGTIEVNVSNTLGASNKFYITIKNPINTLTITKDGNEISELSLSLGNNDLKEANLTADLTLNYGSEATYQWSFDNTNGEIIEINQPTSPNITVTAKAPGTTTLTVDASLNGSVKTTSISVIVNDYYEISIEQANQITEETSKQNLYYLTGYISEWADYSPSKPATGNKSYYLIDDLSNPVTSNKIKVWESSINGSFSYSSGAYHYDPSTSTGETFESLGYSIGDKIALKCYVDYRDADDISLQGDIIQDKSEKMNLTVSAETVGGESITLNTIDNIRYSADEFDVEEGTEIQIKYTYNGLANPIIVDVAKDNDSTTNYIVSKDGKLSFTFDFNTQEFTPTFVPTSSGGNETINKGWNLVTDNNEIKVGDQIVIAAKDSDKAISTTQKDNNRGEASFSKSGTVITFGSDVQIFTLDNGKIAGSCSFNTGSGYIYAASSSKNYLKTETTLSDNSSWNVSVGSDGEALIIAQGTNTRHTLQYNEGSNLFSCYGSASQKAICLYKRYGDSSYTPEEPTLKSLSITANGTSFIKDETIEFTVTALGSDNQEFPVPDDILFNFDGSLLTTPEKDGDVYISTVKTIEEDKSVQIYVTNKEGTIKSEILEISLLVERPSTGIVKGNKYSYEFKNKVFDENGTKDLNGINWTVQGDGNYWGYDGTKGQQFGSGSNPYKTLTLSSEGYKGGIQTIKINTSGASSINASFIIKINDTQIGNSTKLTASATDYTFTTEELIDGKIEIIYTQSSSKALYIKSISING